MERLSNLLLLSRNVSLLIQATSLLAAIRLGLRVLPFGTVRSTASPDWRGRDGGERARRRRARARTVSWAVETAGRDTFRNRHLPYPGARHSRAAGRQGCKSILRIGVKRDTNGKFIAHACLRERRQHLNRRSQEPRADAGPERLEPWCCGRTRSAKRDRTAGTFGPAGVPASRRKSEA